MPDPQNWHRRADAATSGPLVIFDLDGVISDATHRQWYLRQEPPDWSGFFAAAVDDAPLDAGRALAASVDPDFTVAILTARPHDRGRDTVEWLAHHGVRHELLIVRPSGDRRSSRDYKRDELLRLRDAGFDVRVALDDDESIVAMYREHGVLALYVHSGYYEHYGYRQR